jgi:hypothetical protein
MNNQARGRSERRKEVDLNWKLGRKAGKKQRRAGPEGQAQSQLPPMKWDSSKLFIKKVLPTFFQNWGKPNQLMPVGSQSAKQFLFGFCC